MPSDCLYDKTIWNPETLHRILRLIKFFSAEPKDRGGLRELKG